MVDPGLGRRPPRFAGGPTVGTGTRADPFRAGPRAGVGARAGRGAGAAPPTPPRTATQSQKVAKTSALNAINSLITKASGAERTRLIQERNTISNIDARSFDSATTSRVQSTISRERTKAAVIAKESEERIAELKAKELTQKEFTTRRTIERLRTGTTQTQFFTFEEQEREKERERQRRARELRRQQLRKEGKEIIQEPSEKAFGVFETALQRPGTRDILSESELARELKSTRGFVTFKAPQKEDEIGRRELFVPSLKLDKPSKVLQLSTGGKSLVELGQVPIKEDKGLFGASTITAAPTPEGFFETTAISLAKQREEARRLREKGQPDILKEIEVGSKLFGFDILRFGKAVKEDIIGTTKAVGIGLFGFGKKVVTGEGFPSVGPSIKAEPGIAATQIAGDILFLKGTGKLIKVGEKGVELGRARLSPKFKGVKKTTLGEQIIKDIPRVEGGKFELGLIPKGKHPRLDIDPVKLVAETKIPLKQVPKLPKLTKRQRSIVTVGTQEGEIITGSLAQKTLVEGGRGFGDIDILSKVPSATAARIARGVKGVKVKKVTITDAPGKQFDIFRIVEKRTGRQIADIDPIRFAEEGFATKFPTTRVVGLEIVSPKARLAAKAAQLARGKTKGGKVAGDIGILTGQPGLEKSPLIRGAFGFTRKEQAAFKGQRGIVTTSARDLFKTFRPKVKVTEPGLFATPSDIATGRALTRTTRLALAEKEASLIDIITGDFSLRKGKPQIVFFEDITIGKQFKPFGFPSSELEVTLPTGAIIRKVKTPAVTIIEGRRVPIIKAEIVGEGSDVANKLAGVSTELQRDISKAQRGLLTKRQATKVSKRIRKQTGLDIDILSRQPRVRPVVSPLRVGVSTGVGISRKLAGTKLPSGSPTTRRVSGRPSARPSARPSVVPSVAPSIAPSGVVSGRPSGRISGRVSGRPSARPSGKPSPRPRVPPTFPRGVPRGVPPIFISLPRGKIKPIEIKPRKEKRRKFRGTPSLSVVLGGMGTRLTRQQIAGKETISPLLIRQIGNARTIRRIV